MNKNDVERVSFLLSKKFSHKEIAEALQTTTKKVQSFCSRYKLKSQNNHLNPKIDNDLIAQMVADDIQRWTIAEYFDCSTSCIDRRIRAMGIGSKRTGPKSGDRHTNWKGGVTYRKGYRYLFVPEHPNAINDRYVAEHRLVMEQKLGRYLDRSEVVHHKDANPLNNHPDNLELFDNNGEHLKHELTGRVPNWTPEGRKRILDGVRRGNRQRRSPPSSESCDSSDTQPIDHPQE